MPRIPLLLVAALLLASPLASAETLELGEPVVMRAAAVGETPQGLVGSTASVTIRAATNGSGHVFLDTFPLTQVDMQGSARLAARVASQLTGIPLANRDLFFVIRSGSEQIGGPSAGATLAVGAAAALAGWKVRPDVLMTGTINPDGSVGPVGGIPEKAEAAARAGMSRFLFPAGQEIAAVQGDPARGVDMRIYCEQQLDIECLPVSDVREAIGLMTDHVIERPQVTGNVTGAVFHATLAPLSQELVDEAARLVSEADEAVAALPASPTRDALEARLAQAQETLSRARDATSNGTFYTAASLSFQTAINAHAVRDSARFVADGQRALAASLVEARAAVAEARRDIDAFHVGDASRFESAGAAQDRLLQAEAQLASAEALAARGQLQEAFEAIESASFATERAETARWWLRLAADLPAGESVTREQLEGAARDTLTASKEVVTYVEAVFASASGSGTLTSAREKLEQANRAMERGYYPGAMMLALEAEVRASALLKLATFGGRVPDSVFEDARLRAAAAIQEARARGVEPLLAQSVYEFSFAQPEPADRLGFLGMARVTANLAGLPGLFLEPAAPQATSRFQGIPDVLGVPHAWVAASFAVGLALGAGVGLAALMPRDEDDEEETATAPRPGEDAERARWDWPQ